MSIAQVQASIESFLSSHPLVRPFESRRAASQGVRLKRYLVGLDRPIGHEHTTTTLQNLWVRRDDVRLSRLHDIHHVIKTAGELNEKDKANSNLFAVPQFNDCDLVRFGVRSTSEAVRVLAEICF